MRILAIETSCDETAVALVEAVREDADRVRFSVQGNALLSQVDIHKEYGGVYPMLAKRAHSQNLVPILEAALEEAGLRVEDAQVIPEETRIQIATLLEREPELAEMLFSFAAEAEKPPIDAIAVTYGPGLEPALWVGVNFAKALSLLWNIPVVAVNHLEGHILSSLLTIESEKEFSLSEPELPLLSLIISGGHTELVVSAAPRTYERVGETRDDAVGEAYDKVARMLGLPYPGGPEVSRLAEKARAENVSADFKPPRPMQDAPNCDFSFSGLKTAVMYLLKARGELSEDEKMLFAREFEDAVADVLWKKSERALRETGARTLALGGGVSANSNIKSVFRERMKEYSDVALFTPAPSLTGDNAVMIAIAGFYHAEASEFIVLETLRANGNLSLV